MTEQGTAGGLDFEALRRAVEQGDADSLTGFYAEDAEMLTVNRNTTPSSPQVLRGKEQIAEHLADVCGRDMTHRIENEVVGQYYSLQRGVRVPRRHSGLGCGDARRARRPDRPAGQRRGLGRVGRATRMWCRRVRKPRGPVSCPV
jgi:hypothetical protein